MTLKPTLEKVLQIGKLNLIGTTIPFTWYQNLKFPSGKPHLPAITILADIVEWYKPVIVRDELTGEVTAYRKKFKGKILQKPVAYFPNLFGFTKKQTRDAFQFLEDLKLIQVFYGKSRKEGGKFGASVVILDIFPEKIIELSINATEVQRIVLSDDFADELQGNTSNSIKKPIKVNTATRIKESWTIPDVIFSWVEKKQFKITKTQLEDEQEKFVDYWLQRADKMAKKKDWTAAFRTWIRNCLRFKAEKQANEPVKSKNKKIQKCQLCIDYKNNPELKPCPFHK